MALAGKNEFTSAVENYEIALNYDSSNKDFVIMIHNSIDAVHPLSGDIHKALSSYHQALISQFATPSNDRSEMATICGNITHAYWKGDDLTDAMKYYTKQLEL